ncbi:hypothetical protein [Rhizobium sp. FKY42]|uniref:hypothetical protein n=1 Tax=Rhizobium sp. FKY42 TaxID=2562310 RepID=UPI001485653A|nr:hypothetical protein [Rhizobium sp. FKY42]
MPNASTQARIAKALIASVALSSTLLIGGTSPGWSLSISHIDGTRMAQAETPAAPAAPAAPASPSVPAAPVAPSAPAPSPDASSAPSPTDPVATPAQVQSSGKVEIIRDLSKLPAPVARMRNLINEAAATGDIERLRPLAAFDPAQMQVGAEGDAIEAIKSLSGDPDGQEIMAILMDLLQTGAAHINVGKPDEMYVWPYFVGKPLNKLTGPERVELLRIITAGDLMSMEEGNNYNFYRIGITPTGQWKVFAGGD